MVSGAPTIGATTQATFTSATVNWTAPGTDNGSAVTSYLVNAIDSTTSGNGVSAFACVLGTSCVVTGLHTGDSYTFTVEAVNTAGDSPASGASTPALVLTVVLPPTGPTNAPPPTNETVPASTFGTPTSVTTSSTTSTTVSETSGGASETITVPAGALPSGTTVSVYPVTNTAPLVAQVPTGSSYVLSFAVTWEAPNGTSPTATTPITMTITDPSIVAGDTIYEVTSAGLVAVGTATANGTVTITFSSDPTFLVTQKTLVAQLALTITTLSSTVGTALNLVTSGGAGTGVVSFTVTNGTATGCTINGSSLTVASAGTCLVTATKAADSTYLVASSSATTVTFVAEVVPVALHATRVNGSAVVGRTVTLTITGTGFYGAPKITSNEAGTKAIVTHDSGKSLTVGVTVRAGSRKGEHTFTIRLANGRSCKVNYSVK